MRETLFASVQGGHGAPLDEAALTASGLALPPHTGKRPLTMLKKFRFQLLSAWIAGNLPPQKIADIGGGKGLLAYLLNQNGFDSTVIDPIFQRLPEKYKNLEIDRQIKIGEMESVMRISAPFSEEMAEKFDMLVAMHAHGCNIALIDAAARYGKGFLILPCCIIDEPLRPEPGVLWLVWLAEYARKRGFALQTFRLNFKGQNIGLYAPPRPNP